MWIFFCCSGYTKTFLQVDSRHKTSVISLICQFFTLTVMAFYRQPFHFLDEEMSLFWRGGEELGNVMYLSALFQMFML